MHGAKNAHSEHFSARRLGLKASDLFAIKCYFLSEGGGIEPLLKCGTSEKNYIKTTTHVVLLRPSLLDPAAPEDHNVRCERSNWPSWRPTTAAVVVAVQGSTKTR